MQLLQILPFIFQRPLSPLSPLFQAKLAILLIGQTHLFRQLLLGLVALASPAPLPLDQKHQVLWALSVLISHFSLFGHQRLAPFFRQVVSFKEGLLALSLDGTEPRWGGRPRLAVLAEMSELSSVEQPGARLMAPHSH